MGGINGANTRNMFDTKKNAITGYHAWNGEFHAYVFEISVPVVRIRRSPPETRVLIIDSGYEEATIGVSNDQSCKLRSKMLAVEHKQIGITRWNSGNKERSHKPLREQTSHRRVVWLVARKER